MAIRAKAAKAAQSPRKRTILPAEVRVDDLMSAAAELFVTKGIEGTIVSDIVERAGVGKGTFYHYFATKEDVIVALRERFSRDFADAVAEKIAACPDDDHHGRFAAWLRAAVEAYLGDYKLHDVVFHGFGHSSRDSQDKEIVVVQLAALLAEGAKAAAWSLPDVRAAAIVIYDGMHGAVDDAIAAGDHDPDAIYQRLFALLRRILVG